MCHFKHLFAFLFHKMADLFFFFFSDVLEDVIKNCNYTRAFKDDVIVVQGDRGDW